MDTNALQTALEELGHEIGQVPRHPTLGYQGGVRFRKMIAVAVFEGDDGRLYVADPAELVDGHPDLALREWITVRGEQAGGREKVKPGGSGLPIEDLIGILGGGSPTGTTPLALLRALLGGRR